MAIVTLYFSTTGAGLQDGSTWANRAPFLVTGTVNSIIRAFNFGGTDSMMALLDNTGTYAFTTSLAVGSFTVAAPTIPNPLIFHGCDNTGTPIGLTSPVWTSTQVPTWMSLCPTFTATTVTPINVATAFMRFINISTTATNNPTSLAAGLDYVSITSSQSNTAAIGISSSIVKITNCYVKMAGTSYAQGIAATNGAVIDNVRVEGNPSATSGVRAGIAIAGTTANRRLSRSTVFNHAGIGILDSGANAINSFNCSNNTVANCGGTGISNNVTASQSSSIFQYGNMITGCGGFGIDAGAADIFLSQSRLRNNTSGNLTNFANYPINMDVNVSNIYGSQAAADAAEYVDSTNLDFRIKYGSPIWGFNYGVADQPNPGGGSGGSYAFVG